MSLTKRIFSRYSKEDKELRKMLKVLVGIQPKYLRYYVIALTHSSTNEESDSNNERLEYLGDAYLGFIVAEYLFKKYPTKEEGYLTEMRSKIVSRNALNEIALNMGIPKIIRYKHTDRVLKRSQIFGNALEALVGAVYLDLGFHKTREFILNNILKNYVDMDELEHTEYNFKNKLYTWAQRREKSIEIKTISETLQAGRKIFSMGVLIDNKILVEATGYSKKEAGQRAAEMALKKLNIP